MLNYELSDEMLKANGWAYLFDLTCVQKSGGEDSIQDYIRNIYLSAIEALSKQRSIKLKRGPLLLWNCYTSILGENNQPTDGYVLIVTPFYYEITGRDSEPVIHTMRSHNGFVRSSSATPILEGTVPGCLFVDRQDYPIDLDQDLLDRLSDIFEEQQYMLSLTHTNMAIRSNPYSGQVI